MGYFADNFEFILEDESITRQSYFTQKRCFKEEDIKYLKYHSKSTGKDYTGSDAFDKAFSDYFKKHNSGKSIDKSIDDSFAIKCEIVRKCQDAGKKGNLNLNSVLNL